MTYTSMLRPLSALQHALHWFRPWRDTVDSRQEEAAKWITFDNKAPSLQLIGIILFTMMSIIGIILFSYRRHKTLTYRQLQLSKDDLRHRLEALASLKDRLTENEQNTLEAISNEIERLTSVLKVCELTMSCSPTCRPALPD